MICNRNTVSKTASAIKMVMCFSRQMALLVGLFVLATFANDEPQAPSIVSNKMISRGPTDKTVLAGNKAVFHCRTVSSAVKIQWLRNNTDLKVDGIRVVKVSGRTNAILLPWPLPADSGTYTCRVQWDGGVETASAKLVVLKDIVESRGTFATTTTRLSSTTTPGPILNPTSTVPTKIIQPPQKYLVYSGEEAFLPCKTDAAASRVVWLFQQRELLVDGRSFVRRPGGLLLPRARPQNSGTYTCMFGNNTISSTLTVKASLRPRQADVECGSTETTVQWKAFGGRFTHDSTKEEEFVVQWQGQNVSHYTNGIEMWQPVLPEEFLGSRFYRISLQFNVTFKRVRVLSNGRTIAFCVRSDEPPPTGTPSPNVAIVVKPSSAFIQNETYLLKLRFRSRRDQDDWHQLGLSGDNFTFGFHADDLPLQMQIFYEKVKVKQENEIITILLCILGGVSLSTMIAACAVWHCRLESRRRSTNGSNGYGFRRLPTSEAPQQKH